MLRQRVVVSSFTGNSYAALSISSCFPYPKLCEASHNAGKMQFYLSALDETVKLPDENPSIGIIICKSKRRTKVEYTLRKSSAPIGVATYSYHDNLPENMRGLLPTPDEIAAIIAGLEDTGMEDKNDE